MRKSSTPPVQGQGAPLRSLCDGMPHLSPNNSRILPDTGVSRVWLMYVLKMIGQNNYRIL